MQFQLMLVSVFLKTCVKGHGDSSSRLLEKPYQATLNKSYNNSLRLLGICSTRYLLPRAKNPNNGIKPMQNN